MTNTSHARVAGGVLLLYIVTGIAALAIVAPISGATAIADKLTLIAADPWRVRIAIVLAPLMSVYALVLGVTFRALTRDHDPDLAMLGFAFRSAEGVIGLTLTVATVTLLWLATADTAASLDPAARDAVGSLLVRVDRANPFLSAFAFSMGSLCFSVVFARARSIPTLMARLGVAASAILVVILPLQLAGLPVGGAIVANGAWLPMLVFELALALRLLAKGKDAVMAVK